MIKGILLGISISIFIVSLFFLLAGVTGILQENLITGAVIGTSAIMSYSLIALIVSFITSIIIILWIRNS